MVFNNYHYHIWFHNYHPTIWFSSKTPNQTKDNIIHLIQKSIEQFNRRKKVCAIFFDIGSAFDKVWHNGLIYKLCKLNLPEYLVAWCLNLLTQRTFSVQINEDTSEVFNISAGLPQGAVLSPLLFSIYINDIPKNIRKHRKYFLLFAENFVLIPFSTKLATLQT